MPSQYRQRNDSDTWHFCSNCSSYPNADYEVHQEGGTPTSGELCNECQSKRSEDNCQ
jgi:hypothetical protein